MSKVARMSLDTLDAALKATPATRAYGFVVSQAIYDGLKAKVPEKFPGGNCFGSTPIIVDPKLASTEFDIATTQEAWTKRLQEIDR